MNPVIIKNWSTTRKADPWKAPEQSPLQLQGEIYGHPNFEDGARVTTSAVLEVKGRLIKTERREYLLDGPPEESYAKWCKEKGIEIDPDNPIKAR